jgi:hypothetical protein
MKNITILAVTLALAACGTPEAPANNDGAATDVPNMSEPADAPAPAVGNSAEVVPLPAPAASPIAAFPAAFQGRWGMVPNDCDPDMADVAKGLMVVSADALKFYESRAKVGKLEQLTPNAIKGTLDYAGEGQTWSKQTTLTLQDDGKTLVREEADPVLTNTYSKCPASSGNS